MRGTLLNFLTAFLATVTITSLTSMSAFGQIAAPPENGSIDGFDVNLPTGEVITSRPGVSIGPDNHHGLTYSEIWVDTGWRHAQQPTLSGSISAPVVSFMGSTAAFVQSGSSYVPVFENGATLTKSGVNWTFTSSNGTVIAFQEPAEGPGVALFLPGASGLAYATGITFPDDVIWLFEYREATYSEEPDPECSGFDPPWWCGFNQTYYYRRLESIRTNTGFQIKLDYSTDSVGSQFAIGWHQVISVTAINTSVEYCNPTGDCSGLTGDWPTVTYNASTGEVTNPAGDTTKYTYGGPGYRLSAIRRPGATGDTVTFAYNGSNQVSSVSTGGATWSYSYTASTTTVTNPDSGTTVETYNGNDQVTQRQVGSQATDYTYCTSSTPNCHEGLLRTIELPEGQTTTYEYDARANITEVTMTDSADANPITTSATYASSCTNPLTCNQPLTTTDAAGNTTNYSYNSTHGGVTQMQLPAAGSGEPRATIITDYTTAQARFLTGPSTWTTSASIHVPLRTRQCRTAATCSGTVNEQRVEYAYPSSSTPNNLQPTSVTSKLGNGTLAATSAFTYNDLGQVESVDGPLTGTGDTSYTIYESGTGRVLGTISADPDGGGSLPRLATRITYDDGLVIRRESGTVTGTNLSTFSADQREDTEYDDYGRPVVGRHRHVTGTTQYSVVQVNYDNMGLVECTAQRMNAPLTTTTLPAACTPMTAGSNGPDRITKNVYDAYGRVTQVRSGVGSTLEQATQTLAYLTGSTRNGQLNYVEDAEGNRTTYIYDAFGRLYQTRYPSATTAHSSNAADYDQVTFDAYGRVSTYRTRRGESFAFTLDNLGRTTRVDVPTRSGLAATHTRDVFYGYDLMGNLEYARFDSASGEGITNTFNALGQLLTASNNMDAVTRTLSYQYDTAGRRTRITHPDANYWVNAYDLLNRLTNLPQQGTTALGTRTYTAQGRPSVNAWTNSTASNNQSSWTFDAAGRLSNLAINVNGTTNDVAWTFASNPASQLASETRDNDAYAFGDHVPFNLDYTVNGLNQYSALDAVTYSYDTNGNLTSDGVKTYTYDTENRLVTAVQGASTVTLRYDPLGRLYEVTDASGNKRRLYYDGRDLVLEYSGTGTLLRRFVHGPGAGDNALIWYEGSGVTNAERRYLHTDRLGSIVAVADYQGNLIAANAYDEFGVPDQHNQGRFQYTGQVWVPELGMYYYKARMYSPTLGRFMQTDPIGYADGMNMYAYVGNDPISWIDPLGLNSVDPDENGNCPQNHTFNDETNKCDPPIVVGGSTYMGFSGGGDRGGFYGDGGGRSRGPGLAGPGLVIGGDIVDLELDSDSEVETIVVGGNRQSSVNTGSTSSQPIFDNCSIGYQVADWSLWGLGIVGDGMSIVGILTANPVLVAAGRVVSVGANIGSGVLHASAGDFGALAGDGVGIAAGALPGGGAMWRRVGGAVGDPGLNAGGRFVVNHPARRRAQDRAFRSAQGEYASGVLSPLGGC